MNIAVAVVVIIIVVVVFVHTLIAVYLGSRLEFFELPRFSVCKSSPRSVSRFDL